MTANSIGLIELTSIAAGFLVTDAMLKTASVEVMLSRSICSGKYMVMVRGEVGAVEASVAAGIGAGNFSKNWNTNPILRLRMAASCREEAFSIITPSSRMVPLVGESKQPRMCIRSEEHTSELQ